MPSSKPGQGVGGDYRCREPSMRPTLLQRLARNEDEEEEEGAGYLADLHL